MSSRFYRGRAPDGRLELEVPYRGVELIEQPMYNKSSAFTVEERRTFGLDGLLPDQVSTMELQARRVYDNIVRKSEPIERYIGLAALQDRNEHLFYRVLLDNLEEFLPIVYTPTVGQASREFSHIFRRARGTWITPEHRGRVKEVLANNPFSDVRLIVVTDNQAILGIGDQGVGGMVIPVGKLAIYCAAAGIHPAQTLPISLDVGTNNQELLDDELYLGWRKPRLEGEDYFDLIEEFVEAVEGLYPGALVQWEDFRNENAHELLGRYRSRLLSFNDDIQGTGATALAGILAAGRATGVPLIDHRVLIVGAGAAGGGIAVQLRAALAADGLAGDDLTRAVAVLDSRGPLIAGRDDLTGVKPALAWPDELAASAGLGTGKSLVEIVAAYRPTVLIGTSGRPGMFTEEVVRAVAAHAERPLIFPFSNPNRLSEAEPADVVRWTDGAALIATGSPFEPVPHNGHEHRIGQGNNAFIFPGIGLGALVAEAGEVTDAMFTAAARALAESVAEDELSAFALYPSVSRLREVTRSVAIAVVAQASDDGIGKALEGEDVAGAVDAFMWEPEYPVLVPV
ncbi:MAG: NAD-dependent malic enzyme [bacterium]|nr:NAD-dependent malic enzyme [bacterium]